MKELYYTPTVEDFCVGFRYEYRDNYHSMNPKEPDEVIWRRYVLGYDGYFESPPCPFGYYKEGQLMNDFRVKYLDQMDIEELGWEFIYAQPMISGYFQLTKNSEYRLSLFESNILISRKNPVNDLITTVFLGEIKNFNELQRLMNQLRIL